jgi:replicative DNA helicase
MGKPFQERLVQLIMDDAPFANQIGEVLNFNFLELKHLQSFTKLVYDFKKDYGKHPNRDSFETILRNDISGEPEPIQKKMREFFARIVSGGVKEVDEAYVKEKSLDFCRKQNVREAMVKCIDLVETVDFEEISKVMNESLKLGSDNNIGYQFLDQFEDRYSFKARNPVSTGHKVLDNLTQGGTGSGDLGVVIAPTGAGKSMVLVDLGAAALEAGLNVVHYTLELSDEMVGLRYDARLTGIGLDALKVMKNEVFDEIKEVPGKLIIKEYPTKSATTETIKNHIERLIQRGFKPDLVIVDYGDLLKPCRYSKEKRNDLETIYEELRAIGQIYKCPVWTASQTNRSGLNAEVITMESISEAFSKCFVADFIFSCSRTITDKQTNSGRYFVAKNRYGPDGIIIPIHMDTSRVKIEVYEPTGETKDEIEKASAKEQEARLKERYRKKKEEEKKNNN